MDNKEVYEKLGVAKDTFVDVSSDWLASMTASDACKNLFYWSGVQDDNKVRIQKRFVYSIEPMSDRDGFRIWYTKIESCAMPEDEIFAGISRARAAALGEQKERYVWSSGQHSTGILTTDQMRNQYNYQQITQADFEKSLKSLYNFTTVSNQITEELVTPSPTSGARKSGEFQRGSEHWFERQTKSRDSKKRLVDQLSRTRGSKTH